MLHTTAGYAVGAAMTYKYVFDHKPTDIFWCTADCGWITGHTYVAYGEGQPCGHAHPCRVLMWFGRIRGTPTLHTVRAGLLT